VYFQKLTLATVATYALQSASAESIFEIASGAENFSTLVTAVHHAGLADTLSGDGSFTVFAPTNAAFGKVPADTLTKLLDETWLPQLKDLVLYHALGSKVLSTDLVDGMMVSTLNGESITISTTPPSINGNSMIITDGLVDIEADNGVIHGIDTVLAPTSLTSNIVDIAAGNNAFSTLVAAVTAAELVDALSGEGPFTVFAPTNDAFAALDAGTVDSLLLPENKDQLIKILQYHVVAANADSSVASGDYPTLSGDNIKVENSDSGVMINDAKVVIADVIASNGIIHAIDKVLMPPDDATPPETDEATLAPTPSATKMDVPAETMKPTMEPTSSGMEPTSSGAIIRGSVVAAVATAAGAVIFA
jgi:transforming growth factor-beta-induced protein